MQMDGAHLELTTSRMFQLDNYINNPQPPQPFGVGVMRTTLAFVK